MNRKINVDLLSIVFLIISLTLLIYVCYKDLFIQKSLSFNAYYYKYYIASVSLVILSLLSFKLNVNLKKNIILVLFSILIGLYLVEFYLSYKYHFKEIHHNINLKKYNKQNKFEFYLELKKKGFDIVPRIDPSSYFTVEKHLNEENFFPLAGISKKITLSCNELGYFSKYESDRYGFNNNDSIWDKINIDIILIGDSFANGSCVNRPDNIADKLKNINDLNVLNLGFAGNGPLIELASLKEYMPNRFKNIVWLYYEGNDLKNLEIEEKNNTLKKYILNKKYKQNLKNKQLKIDNFLKKKVENIIKKEHLKHDLDQNIYNFLINQKSKKFDFLRFLKLYTIRELTIESIFGIKVNKNFEKIILEAKKVAKNNNANFIFVYIPEYARYTKKIYNTNSYLNYKDVKKIILKNDINFLDLKEIFSQKEFEAINLYATPVGGHFNPVGYNFLAKKIYGEISK